MSDIIATTLAIFVTAGLVAICVIKIVGNLDRKARDDFSDDLVKFGEMPSPLGRTAFGDRAGRASPLSPASGSQPVGAHPLRGALHAKSVAEKDQRNHG